MQPERISKLTEQPKDITSEQARQEILLDNPLNEDALRRMKKSTTARIGVGKTGARLNTQTMLTLRADHANARDSVLLDVDPEYLEKLGLFSVQTKCSSKDQYLTRPDLGRRFDEKNQTVIRQVCGENPKILLVIGDGLSSNAITANAIDCAAAIRQGLKTYGIELGKSLFIQYARVGAMDHIGQITGAELICMLVGERPGLATSESMSAYITYMPRLGIPESKRTVVSNIHRQGTPAVEAGAHIASMLHTMLEKKASGIDLR